MGLPWADPLPPLLSQWARAAFAAQISKQPRWAPLLSLDPC